jgi:predicted TIM-barrel fold metal-dependent hydrolase
VFPGGFMSDTPFVVISSDTHVGATTYDAFTPYFDAEYREQWSEFAASAGDDLFAMARMASEATEKSDAGDAETAQGVGALFAQIGSQQVDEADPIRRTFKKIMATLGVDADTVETWAPHYSEETIAGGGDSQKRLKILESLGIVGEVSIPGAALGGLTPAFGAGITGSSGDGFGKAQMQAYNRWLADFCNDAPGRRAGVLQVDLHDIDGTIADMTWGKEHGVWGGIMLPSMSTSTGLPGYTDPYYEPLWSACEELGMVLNLHVGAQANDVQLYGSDMFTAISLSTFEQFWLSRRPVWFLILGGVFDRHLDLKMSVIENTIEWVPQCIQEMETQFRGFGFMKGDFLERKPGEYFGTNVFLGASIMGRASVEKRHEIGIGSIMWGSDFPHPEGLTPYVRDAMKVQLGGIPEPEQRMILGETIGRVYGFDMNLLAEAAATCGPTPQELSEPLAASAVPAHASPMYREP